MIHYLRRGKTSNITPKLVMAALERNFNGCEEFSAVCKEFLRHVSVIVSHGQGLTCTRMVTRESPQHTVSLSVTVRLTANV